MTADRQGGVFDVLTGVEPIHGDGRANGSGPASTLEVGPDATLTPSAPSRINERLSGLDEPYRLAARARELGLKRVHVLAWRDLEAPDAGGSELHAHRIASIWANAGLDVTLRTGSCPSLDSKSVRNGYQVVRRGGRMSVFPLAALGGLLPGRHHPDGLMEIWHGMPFFSPLWARCPRISFAHHVHADTWDQLLPGPMAKVGKFMEMTVSPRVYRRSRVVTACDSVRDDLVSLMGMQPSQVKVVPHGVDPRFSPGGSRSSQPMVVAVGRLTPTKRFDLLIDSLVEARRSVPGLRATIVGEGLERPKLEAKVAAAGATGWIELPGYLPDHELIDTYRRAWVVASASSREGWNMTITEAGACGTPAVATDVVGHRDSVWHEVSGLLAEPGRQLTAALVRVLHDVKLRSRLGRGALDRASVLTWEATAAGTLAALVEEAQARS